MAKAMETVRENISCLCNKERTLQIWRVFFFNFFFVALGQKVWPILNLFLFWLALEELFRYYQQFWYYNKHW